MPYSYASEKGTYLSVLKRVNNYLYSLLLANEKLSARSMLYVEDEVARNIN